MKKAILIIIVLITGCVTTSSKKDVVQIEFTFKQNMINLGTTLLGAGLVGLAYYGASKKMEDTIREQKASIPIIVIPTNFP